MPDPYLYACSHGMPLLSSLAPNQFIFALVIALVLETTQFELRASHPTTLMRLDDYGSMRACMLLFDVLAPYALDAYSCMHL